MATFQGFIYLKIGGNVLLLLVMVLFMILTVGTVIKVELALVGVRVAATVASCTPSASSFT